jgi:hypothetical protein
MFNDLLTTILCVFGLVIGYILASMPAAILQATVAKALGAF